MNGIDVGYVLLQVGVLLGTGIVMYSGWLYIKVPGANPHNASGDCQPSGATPEAMQFPALLQY
jgi:hypothetical protein